MPYLFDWEGMPTPREGFRASTRPQRDLTTYLPIHLPVRRRNATGAFSCAFAEEITSYNNKVAE